MHRNLLGIPLLFALGLLLLPQDGLATFLGQEFQVRIGALLTIGVSVIMFMLLLMTGVERIPPRQKTREEPDGSRLQSQSGLSPANLHSARRSAGEFSSGNSADRSGGCDGGGSSNDSGSCD